MGNRRFVVSLVTTYTRRSIGMRGKDGPVTLLAIKGKGNFLMYDGSETSDWRFAYPFFDKEEERRFAAAHDFILQEPPA